MDNLLDTIELIILDKEAICLKIKQKKIRIIITVKYYAKNKMISDREKVDNERRQALGPTYRGWSEKPG